MYTAGSRPQGAGCKEQRTPDDKHRRRARGLDGSPFRGGTELQKMTGKQGFPEGSLRWS